MKRYDWLILFFILSFVVLSTVGCTERKNSPKAVQGILDLSGWDFTEDGQVPLNGQWEFYWQKLFGPENFQHNLTDDKKQYIHHPNLWKGTKINDKELPAKGYATYRLIVRNVGTETLVNARITDETLGLVNVPVPGW